MNELLKGHKKESKKGNKTAAGPNKHGTNTQVFCIVYLALTHSCPSSVLIGGGLLSYHEPAAASSALYLSAALAWRARWETEAEQQHQKENKKGLNFLHCSREEQYKNFSLITLDLTFAQTNTCFQLFGCCCCYDRSRQEKSACVRAHTSCPSARV